MYHDRRAAHGGYRIAARVKTRINSGPGPNELPISSDE
jgi:hypothetical protein